MEQTKSLSTQANSSILKYKKPNHEEGRWWEVHFIECDFYLTDEEHKKFLNALAGGTKIVQIGRITLTDRFLYIQQVETHPARTQFDYKPITDEDGKIVSYEAEPLY